MEMRINQWCEEAHRLSREKGWYEGPREVGTLLMLMVSELSEAMEEDRVGNPALYQVIDGQKVAPFESGFVSLSKHIETGAAIPKPEGSLTELADCVIRIFDYCGARGLDLEGAIALKHHYNKTRPHRHGGKKY